MTLLEISPVVTIIKDIILALAAIMGATIGIVGLWTWRRQLAGTSKFEMAKKLLISVYRTRNTIYALRNPQFTSKEVPTFRQVISDDDLSSSEFREYLTVAYKQRWNRLEAAYKEFELIRAEAEVVIGKEINSLCNGFENCYYNLAEAAHHYFKWIDDIELHKKVPESFRNQTEITMGIVSKSEDDWYGKMLRRVVFDFEESLLPVIKMK